MITSLALKPSPTPLASPHGAPAGALSADPCRAGSGAGALQGFGEVGANRGHQLGGVVGDCLAFEANGRMDVLNPLMCSTSASSAHAGHWAASRALGGTQRRFTQVRHVA